MAKGSVSNYNHEIYSKSLSLKYAVFCIVDMVGLFPVIALPRAIINCGWMGIPLALIVFTIEIYTAVLLGRCWIIGEQLDPDIVQKKRRPYGALIELAFGKGLSNYVAIILDLSIFGASVPDLLIASQNLQVIGWKLTDHDSEISYCYWLVIVGVLIMPIMWFGSPKDMKLIGITSVSVVLLTSILTWSSILFVRSGNVNIPEPSFESLGIAYGILAFQFDIHPMILSVQMDMKNKKDVGKAVLLAFMVSGGLFVVTMVLCYSLLGDKVHYNTLQSLPESSLLDLALCLATLQVCLSMAVGSSPFFQDVEHSLGVPQEFGWKRVVLRSSIVMFAVFIGETVPRFDLFMGLVGGALTGQLVFLFPTLLYRRLKGLLAVSPPPSLYVKEYGTFQPDRDPLLVFYDPLLLTPPERRKPRSLLASVWGWLQMEGLGDSGQVGWAEGFLLLAVPLLGVGATLASTYFSFRETVEYAEMVPSCLINTTIATQYVSYNFL